jgi:hypothetical protein
MQAPVAAWNSQEVDGLGPSIKSGLTGRTVPAWHDDMTDIVCSMSDAFAARLCGCHEYGMPNMCFRRRRAYQG